MSFHIVSAPHFNAGICRKSYLRQEYNAWYAKYTEVTGDPVTAKHGLGICILIQHERIDKLTSGRHSGGTEYFLPIRIRTEPRHIR